MAENDSRILGWCAVASGDRDCCWLDYCWVLPEAAGRGIGRMLVRRAFQLAAEMGSGHVRVIADPHAEGFMIGWAFIVLATIHRFRRAVAYRCWRRA
ncbi:MAG: GNAT family N-acetyltransferase [Candidatus Binatia bacterium]